MIATLFWVFLVLSLFIGGYFNRDNYGFLGGFGIVWFLILLLGLQVFHSPLN